MAEKKVMKLASRGKRFGAACIDLAVPVVAYIIMMAVFAANGISTSSPGYGYGYGNDFGGFGDDFGYGYGYGYDMGYNAGSRLSGASAAIIIILGLIVLAYIIVEFVLYAKAKSIGKALLGLQVVSSKDGKPFGFWKMVLRECIVKSASGSTFLLGYIWILIDDKNRAWHDKILDSYVVDLKESEKMNKRRAKKAEAAVQEPVAAPPVKVEPVEQAEPVEQQTAVEVNTEIADEAPVEAAEKVDTQVAEAAAPAEEAAAVEEPAAAEEAPAVEEAAAVPEVSMAMKKEELLAAAREAGVKVGSKATKAEIIEAINNSRNGTAE